MKSFRISPFSTAIVALVRFMFPPSSSSRFVDSSTLATSITVPRSVPVSAFERHHDVCAAGGRVGGSHGGRARFGDPGEDGGDAGCRHDTPLNHHIQFVFVFQAVVRISEVLARPPPTGHSASP